jgi:hypothetical protein
LKINKTHDGRQFESSSEEWRNYCEAKLIMTMPDKLPKRRKIGEEIYTKAMYLGRVEAVRGKPAMMRLRDEMITLWKINK